MKRNLPLFCLLTLLPLFCIGQTKDASKTARIGMSLEELYINGYISEEDLETRRPPSDYQGTGNRADCTDSYIPTDPTYTAVARNDDGSLYIPSMGFTFSFCGTTYTDCFINTNGNVSFQQAVGQFSPDGFPYATPMLAPFWADVDTRNTACGQVWYKLFGNYMIVTWDEVGWYNSNCGPLNTFQVIISDGTAPIIGIGNNVQFRYGDMGWTTGTASGGGPFGGFAATVGYNSGDNINYEQVGRFNLDNSNYDGPLGNDDGVHWLDFNCSVFDTGTGSVELNCINIVKSLDADCFATVTDDEVAELLVNGCASATVSIDLTDFGCDDIGDNFVTVTSTSAGVTETCMATVTILEGLCNIPLIDPVGPFCDTEPAVFLTNNNPAGTWGGDASTGVFDPSVGPGIYTVTYTIPNACPPTASLDIEVYQSPEITIFPDPASFCEEVGFIEITTDVIGGDGNYSYAWSTPDGPAFDANVIGLSEGQYTVTVIDGNGCEDIADVVVIMNETPLVVIIDPGIICEEEFFITLEAAPTGGTWTGTGINPDGSLFPNSLGAGIYSYTYIYADNFGCENADIIDLEISSVPLAIATNTGPYCEGAAIDLFGNTDVFGAVTYQWEGPNNYTSTQQNPTDATEEGVYILQVIDLNGCISEQALTIVDLVEAPDSDATNSGPYCPSQAIELFGMTTTTGSTTSFVWTGPNGYTSLEQNPTDATEGGTYLLLITVDGCEAPLAVTEVALSPPPDAIAFNSGPHCLDEPFNLFSTTNTIGSITSYEWTGPNGYISFDQNPTDATEAGDYIVQIMVDGCASALELTTVVINQATPPTISGNTIFCDGMSTVLDGGNQYVNYLWSNGDLTQTTNVNSSGTYTLAVTDVNGCTAEAAIDVTVNPFPTPSITGSTSFCEGSTTVLDAGAYASYIWSDNSTGQTLEVSEGGVYIVTVTDVNGCTAETQVEVTENSSLSPQIDGVLAFCEGEASLLDAGGSYATYLWSDASSGQTLSVDATGDYSVTVSDASGCTGEVSVSVTENPLPTVNIVGTTILCEGETATLTTDGTFTTYDWSNNDSGASITVDASGSYSVLVTDASGCTAEAAIDVTINPLPIPSITGSTSFCEGSTTTLDAGDYASYTWSDNSTGQTVEVSEGGVYIVTVTDVNGCTAETQVEVTENSSLSPQIDGVLTFCEGEASLLDAGGSYATYLWNDASSGQTLSVDATGDYSVTVSDASGCTGEVSVSVTENPLPTVNIVGTTILCEGETATLTTDGTFTTYDWSNNDSGTSIMVDASGTYSVLVTDASGCTAEAAIDVTINPLPIPNITGSTSFCEGSITNLDAGDYASYIWSDNSTGQTLEVSEGGVYIVTVTDVNGCTAETQVEVTENSSLSPQIDGVLAFCEGEASLLDAGGSYATYLWSDASSSQTLSVDATGDYSVTVSDASGCTGEVSVSVTENPLPTVSIEGLIAICEGESTILSADETFANYDWSDNSSNQSTTVDAAGTYNLIVTDDNGCTGEADINVTLNSNPEPMIAGSTTFCEGSSTILDAGAAYESYIWSDNSIGQTIEVTAANTFTVTVTDVNGCTGESMSTVSESSSLNPVISGDLDFCEGENSLLNAGAGFDTYLWSDNSSEQTLLAVSPGEYSVTVSDGSGCTGETDVSIVENAIPLVSISGNIPFCTGDDIELSAETGFTNYLWSDQSLNSALTVTAAGTYAVTVTDDNGCTAEASINAIENANPTPIILGLSTFCADTETTLEVDDDYTSYTWSDGSSDQPLLIDASGTYGVTVTNISGCTGETQWTVTENTALEPAIVGDLDFCEGETSTLTAPTGFSYEWSNNMTTDEITVSTTGQYSLQITDAEGCTGVAAVDVVTNPNPIPEITGSTTFCTGTLTTLDAGDQYDTYSWSDGTSGQTIDVNVANDYVLTVTDNNGCTGVEMITITESTSLSPAISGDLQLCEGDTSTLDAGTGFETYLWSTGDESPTISTMVSGDYSVTVSDASGCTGDGTVSLAVNGNPTANINGVDSFCEGDNTLLNAGGGYDAYLWSDNTVDQVLVATVTGNYGLTVTDVNGCTASSSLEVVENLIPVIDINGPTSFCSGNTATLTVPDTYESYVWSTGDGTASIDLTVGATVSVIVTDANGCTGEAGITVTENTELNPVVSGDLAFCEGGTTTLDVGTVWASYEWSTGEQTPSIAVTEGGNYNVMVTDADGCSGSTNVLVELNQNPDPIIAGSTTFCTGSSTTLDAGGYASWLWSTGDIGQNIETNLPGNYSVVVTDVNGCVGEADISVEESSSLNPVISGLPSFCENENTTLDAGAGFSAYLWSDGSTTQTLTVDLVGDYSVTVSDAGGCSGETIVAVELIAPPLAVLQSNSEICNTDLSGSSMNLYDLIISGDINGVWDDADNSGASGVFDNINFNGVAPGNYNFVYTTNSAITPCTEITYPVVVTVLDCACGAVSLLPVDPICNSGEMVDLSSIVNGGEPGIWSIVASPVGTEPAILNGDLFEATNSDAGEYTLQYELTNMQPLNCPDVFTQVIIVDQQVSAGTADAALSLCTDESAMTNLSDLIIGEDLGGIWVETSSTLSQGNAFDAATGIFNTNGQNAGTYTFQYEVSAGLACPSGAVEATVVINPQPTAIAGTGVQLTCSAPVSSLDAGGSSSGASYAVVWNGPGVVLDGNENTLTPTIEAGGFYELVITDIQTGCVATDMVEVLESADVPVALAGENQELTCDLTTTILQPGEDYGAEYLIEWSGPGITAANMNDLNPEVMESGMYTLIVTLIANGCTSSPDAMEVIDNSTSPDIIVDVPLSSLDCNITIVDLEASSPNSNVEFIWTNANGDVVGTNAVLANIDEEGVYTVIATNPATGCWSTENLEVINNVSDPFVDIEAPLVVDCNNTTVTLDGSSSQAGPDISYTWTGPGISGTTNIPVAEAMSAGTYTLEVLNSTNGCTSEMTVTVMADLEQPNANIANPEELDCQVDEVTLDGSASSSSGNFTYEWLDNTSGVIGNTLAQVVGSTGLYSLVVTNQNNGCSSTAVMEVFENEDIPESAMFDIVMPNCAGESSGYINLLEVAGGAAPYVYSIDGSDYSNSSFYTQLGAGTYDLALEDANGCQWDTTIQIIEPEVVTIDLGTDIELALGEDAEINAIINLPTNLIDTIIWSPSDIVSCEEEDCSTVAISTFNSLLVSATVVDINGCIHEDQLSLLMDKKRKVYIPSAFSPNGDDINELFMIYADNEQIVNVNYFYIYNRWGEEVFQASDFSPNDEEHGWDGRFRGQFMNPGVLVYIAEIEFVDGQVEQYKGDLTLVR